ncbi:hypothetical protein PLICBS_000301 [Purpureocillium lilacinum]|uniref:uncharacterized protein n=1 Tax=Purpureocillium lilacinum TaxID=33203 RepID=UPI002080548C|nr:hypothetical protein PLICBS_000301 [Purpureocillium lilacinum]
MTAAIAIDPFTQQILSFEQRATVVDGPQSSVTRSQVYDNGGKGVSGAGAVLQPTRDGLFQAAAVSGVYDLVSQPPFKCPGSNCTYPDFTSLGICSKCSDVTAKTTKSCDSVEGGWQIQACNFTTPGGFSPQASAGSDAHNGFGYTLLNVSVKVPDPNQPQHLVSMAMIRFADDARATETQWQDTLTAYECNYDACAKAYFWGPVIPFTTLERGFPGNTTYEINLFDLRVMVKALSEVYNPGSPGSDSFAAALYNSPNLTRTVENIATGMSYRMLSGPNATAVTGEVFAVQTYMRLGHMSTAYLAHHFLSNSTQAYLKELLNIHENDDGYLANAALWADTIKRTKEWHFTETFHFIDAHDSPPSSCNVNFMRDCKETGCVISALTNYTKQSLDPSLPALRHAQAAKFIIHFLGDLHQPLHNEDVARGGNGLRVKWDGEDTNLHSVWDSAIAEKLVGGVHGKPDPAAQAWANRLAVEITQGRFKGEKEAWLEKFDIKQPNASAMAWSKEANALICTHGKVTDSSRPKITLT